MMDEHRTCATLSDGSTVSGEAHHVDRAIQIDRAYRASEASWVDRLRAAGVKAAHPDDGWVDRAENKVHLCYPQFNDGLAVGDLLALGYHESWRIVRVTATEKPSPICSVLGIDPWYYHFGDRLDTSGPVR